jgi:hypothetical protein
VVEARMERSKEEEEGWIGGGGAKVSDDDDDEEEEEKFPILRECVLSWRKAVKHK